MERFFGIASTASQSQQQRRLPPLGFPLQLIPGEAQHNDRAENLFLCGISKPGVFEEEMSSLDEKDADTVGRLLCWAALKNKHPGACMWQRGNRSTGTGMFATAN